MCRFVLLTIFSFNILSNPLNCSSTRGSLLSILFLQSYKKAVDEVSNICSLHLSLLMFVFLTFKHSFAVCLIYFCHTPSHVFNRSLINISHRLSFLNFPPIFLSVALSQLQTPCLSPSLAAHFSIAPICYSRSQCPKSLTPSQL